jgi:hypothetical protein
MSIRTFIVFISAFALGAPGAALAKDKGNKGGKAYKHAEKADKGVRKGAAKANKGARDDRDDRDERVFRDRDDENGRGGQITVCHVPPGNPGARHTITIGESAWPAHRQHGDYLGACGAVAGGRGRRTGRFDDLDRNDDGLISPREWPGSQAAFDRLDRNRDGLLGRDEFRWY